MVIKGLSIRIDDKLLDKLHVAADYEGRSANSQILILMRDCVNRFESEHGAIERTGGQSTRINPPRKG